MSYLTDHCSCPQPPSLVPSTGKNTFSILASGKIFKRVFFFALDAYIYCAILTFVCQSLDENEREFVKCKHLVIL